MKCGEKCEVYSRVCGYFRPVSNWNKGKKEEFKDRRTFDVRAAMEQRAKA
jgi:anaerobic ribonucleoside-triphosphate reductase